MHLLDEAQTFDPFPPTPNAEDRAHRRAANHAVGVSALGLAITGAVELAVAILSGSVGLLGDALHNLSDVSTSAVVFLGFRLSRRSANPTHPYGYERAEDLAGLGVALVVWASAAFAGYVSVHKLLEHGGTTNLTAGVVAAVVGIAGNQIVARYKRRVGRRIRSVTLLADAKHSWLDALASLGALAGLVGVAAGLRWADAVAGLVVTAFIVHVGWEITSDVLTHLMDSVDPDVISRAETAALGVEDVEHVHVRARWSGRSLVIETEGFIAAELTLCQAERLGRMVQDAVRAAVPEALSVLWSLHALDR